MPVEFDIPAEGELGVQMFYSKVPFAEDRFAEVVELRPGNRGVVHHAGIFLVDIPEGTHIVDGRLIGEDGKVIGDRGSAGLPRTEGMGLCRGCHNDMLNKTFDKNRVHWPLLSKMSCLGCHNPHASDEKALVRAPMAQMCGKCHIDTMKRQQNITSKHEPVAEGRCNECHDPHSSNFLYLTKKNFDFDMCAATCHDWTKHSTHPIGDKAHDPRNKNLTVSCASCHRTHGTEFKKMLHYKTTTELCIQCHEKFSR
jgi:predicted CXXCH cytochrome family protein